MDMQNEHSLRNEPPMRKYYYVALKQTYEELGDGLLRVTNPDGRSGIFHWDGRWVEGELTQCNIHMAVWTAGPNLPKVLNFRWPEAPVDITRPSGWPEEAERALEQFPR